jgi:hypothetical protein
VGCTHWPGLPGHRRSCIARDEVLGYPEKAPPAQSPLHRATARKQNPVPHLRLAASRDHLRASAPVLGLESGRQAREAGSKVSRMNHIEVGEEVRVFTSGERHRAAMKVLREAGIRLEDPPRFAVEQVQALAEVVATFGQLGDAAEGNIARPGALAGMSQSEFLGRLLRAASDTQAEPRPPRAPEAASLMQALNSRRHLGLFEMQAGRGARSPASSATQPISICVASHTASGLAARSALPATGPPWSADTTVARPRVVCQAMTASPYQCFGPRTRPVAGGQSGFSAEQTQMVPRVGARMEAAAEVASMSEDESVAFLTETQHYTDAEARAELGSLASGEFESLTVSDADGTDYLVMYDAETGSFIVTDNFR